MRHTLSILRRLLLVDFHSQLQYRLPFAFDVIGTLLITVFEFAAIALVLPRFENLGGWRLGEVALLFGMANAAFGLMDMLFSGFDPQFFGQRVRQGLFDQLLLRPIDLTAQVLGSHFALRRLGRIFMGFAILGLAFALTDITWTLAKVLMLLAALLGQVFFFGGLFVVGATITFWTIESIEAINIFTYGGSELISYPMHIYPWWLRDFFTYILPSIFLNYYPALYILEKPDPFGMPPFAPWLAPLAGLLVLALALRFWHFGIQYYQSTGT